MAPGAAAFARLAGGESALQSIARLAAAAFNERQGATSSPSGRRRWCRRGRRCRRGGRPSTQEQELVGLGRGKDAGGADQARRLTSSTEADWGGRSLGGPGGAGSAALRR